MNLEMIITGFLIFGAMLITSKKYKVAGFYLSLVGCVIGLCFFLYLHLNYMAIGCVSGCALSVVSISRHY